LEIFAGGDADYTASGSVCQVLFPFWYTSFFEGVYLEVCTYFNTLGIAFIPDLSMLEYIYWEDYTYDNVLKATLIPDSFSFLEISVGNMADYTALAMACQVLSCGWDKSPLKLRRTLTIDQFLDIFFLCKTSTLLASSRLCSILMHR
jgi:hypothetical protein